MPSAQVHKGKITAHFVTARTDNNITIVSINSMLHVHVLVDHRLNMYKHMSAVPVDTRMKLPHGLKVTCMAVKLT